MFGNIKSHFRGRYFRYEFRTSSVPTLSVSALSTDLAIFVLLGILSALLIVKGISPSPRNIAEAPPPTPAVVEQVARPAHKARSNQKVITFRPITLHAPVATSGLSSLNDYDSKPVILSSSGSIVSARLLNSVEAYDSVVPVIAQLTDFGIGKEFLGKTIIGEATPMPEVDRMRIDFYTLRVDSHTSVPISAQALSIDGTYGLIAQKKEGIVDRSVIAGVHNGVGMPFDQHRGNPNLGFSVQSMLVGALFQGLQQTLQSDISVDRNRSTVLVLKSGQTFVIQLLNDLQKER